MTSSFWLDRPTFVTGATGLVGSMLVKLLIEEGAEVVGLVRDWVPKSLLLGGDLGERITTVRGDICDQALLERILGEYEIDTVFHLAAQTIVPVAERNPVSTFASNISGTWSLLEACRLSPKVRQIVVASSDKAYGHVNELPYVESAPLKGLRPYEVSKVCADLLAQSYAATYSLPIVVSRCGNFYGPGDLNWNRLIPGTIRSVLRGVCPVIRSDGSPIRDYFHVEDGARAYLLLARNLAEKPGLRGEAFNFSNEKPMATIDVARLILKLMKSSLEPEIQNHVSGEIPVQFVSAGKAKRELGWRPERSLEEGLMDTITWYQSVLARGQ